MLKTYKVKNHKIKRIINTEIKKQQINGNIEAMNILKNIGRKYY